ncbi:MAG: preprotein translocase subunit YajC [Planctomycetes bacterium]|nr:preprotein translocase subunit YajC [Planctomycetota bacterium]
MFAIMYFLLIRPQQKQEKKRREMVNALKKGDHVVMNSGLHGVVDSLTENTVEVRVDREVVLTFDRTAIQRSGAASGGDAAPKKSEGAA